MELSRLKSAQKTCAETNNCAEYNSLGGEQRFKEISEQTGVSINTALGRMRYALINLRKVIDKHNIILTN